VTPGYFTALGIPTLRGRTFTEHDDPSAQRVIVINNALAHRYFANDDPVGAALDRGLIVGVVGDVHQAGLDRPADPEIFYPAAQNVTMASDIGMSLVVRTSGPPEPLIDSIRAIVRDVNPRLAIFNVKTMEQVMTDWMWEMNLYRWLIGMFAALAVTIAAIGLFGVMSYTVTARVREFAVRLALGSDPIGLCRIVLARGAWLAAIGLVVGSVTTWQLFAAMGSLPIGGRPDVSTYAVVSTMLLVITLIACVVPAVRVVTVNPVTALRQE
jgi:putative ABC transport system permease protein